MFISEGWSLDSMAFLQVGSEILDAVDRIRNGENRPEGIDEFSPYVLERRSALDYVTTFSSYLSRKDCRWSGFPILAQEAERREALSAALKAAESGGGSSRLAIEEAFGLLLDDRVGRWVATVAAHERRSKGRSIIATEDRRFHFYRAIDPHLKAASANLPPEFGEQKKNLDKLIGTLERCGDAIFSSSQFLSLSRNEAGPDLQASLDHLARLTYMDVTSSAGGASFQTPAILDDPHHLMKAFEVAAYDTLKGPDVAFGELVDRKPIDFNGIVDKADWPETWERVIRLSLHPDWQSALVEFRSQTSDLWFRQTRFEVKAFGKLENLLARHCPELVVEQTRSERWGLNLKVARTIEHVGQAGATAAAGLAIAAISVPLAWIAYLAGATWIIDKTSAGAAKEWLKPLTGRAYLKSTILRAFVP